MARNRVRRARSRLLKQFQRKCRVASSHLVQGAGVGRRIGDVLLRRSNEPARSRICPVLHTARATPIDSAATTTNLCKIMLCSSEDPVCHSVPDAGEPRDPSEWRASTTSYREQDRLREQERERKPKPGQDSATTLRPSTRLG